MVLEYMAKQKQSRRQILKERRQAEKNRKRTIIIVLGIAVIAILGYTITNTANQPKAEPVSEARIRLNPTKGAEDPKVILTEFGDFGCEACQAWYRAGIMDQILARFDGQLQLEWRDFPIIQPPYSQRAGEAGQCAFDQDKFWEFHDVTYDRSSYSALRDDDLISYAEKANLDMQLFAQCFESRQHKATVEFDLDFARGSGFRGTPTFTVNGIPVIGPNPDLIISLIESELALGQ